MLHHTTHLVDFFYSQHTGVRFQIFEERFRSSSGTPKMVHSQFSYGSFWHVLLYCPVVSGFVANGGDVMTSKCGPLAFRNEKCTHVLPPTDSGLWTSVRSRFPL